jgi:uncharacterized protein (TIGR03437 family)
MRFGAILTLCAILPPLGGVTPIPAGPLVEHRANPFDLSNKLVRFTPRSAGGYDIAVTASAGPWDRGSPISGPNAGFFRGFSWRVALPFSFPFAGTSYNEVFLNNNGNLSFGQPEALLYPQRDTWSDGSMRSVGGSLDARSINGQERMIAPLWGLYSYIAGQSTIWSRANATEYVASWDSIRYTFANEGYTPLGRCQFQVRLTPDGAIEFRYQTVAELDGIAGIFTGRTPAGVSLDHFEDPAGDTSPASDSTATVTDILAVDVADTGTALKFTMTMANPVPASVPTGTLYYRIFTTSGGSRCEVDWSVSNVRQSFSSCAGTARASGSQVELFLSKLSLPNLADVAWESDVAWFGNGPTRFDQASYGRPRPLLVASRGAAGIDLSTASGAADGNVYEVFHYPSVPKPRQPSMRRIYQSAPANDDLAVVLTDFRIDDLHNHGSSTGAINMPVQGIGSPGYDPQTALAQFGSSKLQVATGPIYMGPRFSERTSDGVRDYRNYAFAIGWMGHELTHRWAAFLLPESLRDTYCKCHWNEWLHVPSTVSVSPLFSDKPYTETSVMGGNSYTERPDGTFERGVIPYLVPTGMSALDLYLMGLTSPNETPDTFLLTGATGASGNLFRGTKSPVRIADIAARNGARNPGAGSAQRSFALGVYLLYEDGRAPDPAKLRQAQAIEAALIQYFAAATAGRMSLSSSSPSGTPARLRSVSGTGQSGAPGQQLANPLVVELLDAEGKPLSGASIEFSAINAAVSVATATTDARGQASTRITLAASAEAAAVLVRSPGVETLRVSFAATSAGRPAIAPGGVADAFNYQQGVASSTWIAITGTNLSQVTQDWTSEIRDGSLPAELGGVQVTINGRPAPIYFVSPTQVNLLAPLDDTLGNVPVVVRNSSGESIPFTVRKTAALPGFYAPFAANGRFYVTAVALDGTLVGKPGLDPRVRRGARPGEVLLVFASGFGRTDPVVAADRVPSGAPRLVQRPVIRLEDRVLEFAGNGNLVAPGLYQFNVTVPDLPAGEYLLRAEVAGQSSTASVYLTIER